MNSSDAEHLGEKHDYLAAGQTATFEQSVGLLAQIQPNRFNPSDLLPGFFDAEQLAQIVDVFSHDERLRTRRAEVTNPERVAMTYDLPGIGTLDRMGRTEYKGHKICYRLTTPGGKQMAILVAGYDISLGMQVPQHDRLRVVSVSPTRRLLEYSDARTYFMAPISARTAVVLQEWGGESLESSRHLVPLGLATVSRLLARRRISSIPNRDPRGAADTRQELMHARNTLLKPGHLPAIIDVPVVQIVESAR